MPTSLVRRMCPEGQRGRAHSESMPSLNVARLDPDILPNERSKLMLLPPTQGRPHLADTGGTSADVGPNLAEQMVTSGPSLVDLGPSLSEFEPILVDSGTGQIPAQVS